MSKGTEPLDLEERASFFKALGHPTRLLLLNLIKQKPRHGEELAAIMNLKPATISHHLSKLHEVGLLTAEKDQYYQMYSLAEGVWGRSLRDLLTLSPTRLQDAVEPDAYRQKVLKAFFRHGRLTRLPAQLKKRKVVLEKIVESFEIEREYTEKAVNITLLDFHDDVATLRRGLIEHKLMTRSAGIYRRVAAAE